MNDIIDQAAETINEAGSIEKALKKATEDWKIDNSKDEATSASTDSYDSYDYDQDEISDEEYAYGGGTGVFSVEDVMDDPYERESAADSISMRFQNGEKRVDMGSGDYSSMFAAVREKYLKKSVSLNSLDSHLQPECWEATPQVDTIEAFTDHEFPEMTEGTFIVYY
jgi:hypothetical protein